MLAWRRGDAQRVLALIGVEEDPVLVLSHGDTPRSLDPAKTEASQVLDMSMGGKSPGIDVNWYA